MVYITVQKLLLQTHPQNVNTYDYYLIQVLFLVVSCSTKLKLIGGISASSVVSLLMSLIASLRSVVIIELINK